MLAGLTIGAIRAVLAVLRVVLGVLLLVRIRLTGIGRTAGGTWLWHFNLLFAVNGK
jgi:hypothetical protein